MLRVENLSKRFGGLVAMDDVSLDFPAGSLSASLSSRPTMRWGLSAVMPLMVTVPRKMASRARALDGTRPRCSSARSRRMRSLIPRPGA